MEAKDLTTKDLIHFCIKIGQVDFDKRKATTKELINRFGEQKALELVKLAAKAELKRYRIAFKECQESIIDRNHFWHLYKKCKYEPRATGSRYNCTGIDWCAYVRRSNSSAGAWVFIAPDEPGNNVFIPAGSIYANFLNLKYKNL